MPKTLTLPCGTKVEHSTYVSGLLYGHELKVTNAAESGTLLDASESYSAGGFQRSVALDSVSIHLEPASVPMVIKFLQDILEESQ